MMYFMARGLWIAQSTTVLQKLPRRSLWLISMCQVRRATIDSSRSDKRIGRLERSMSRPSRLTRLKYASRL